MGRQMEKEVGESTPSRDISLLTLPVAMGSALLGNGRSSVE